MMRENLLVTEGLGCVESLREDRCIYSFLRGRSGGGMVAYKWAIMSHLKSCLKKHWNTLKRQCTAKVYDILFKMLENRPNPVVSSNQTEHFSTADGHLILKIRLLTVSIDLHHPVR